MRAILLIAAVLSGCATSAQFRNQETEFKPAADRKTFEFKATAAADVGGFDTPEGYAIHMEILSEWMRLNDMCPNGFDIVSKRAVVDAEGLLSKRGKVYYEGRCRS